MNTASYKQMMAELRTEYLQSFKEKFQIMTDLFDQKEWHSLELEFHKLKGTGTTYGVPEVSALCEQLERICRENEQIEKELLSQAIELLTAIRGKYLEGKNFDLETNNHFQNIKKL